MANDTNTSSTDPLLTLITRFRAEAADFNSRAEDDAADDHYHALYDELADRTPACTSAEGAIEALKLVQKSAASEIGGYQAGVLRSVLTYVEGQPAS